MLDYLDTDLKNFINRYVTSFLVWDVIVFFQTNSDEGFTADELAGRLGRQTEEVEQAVADLARQSILNHEGATFAYAPSHGTKLLIDRFVQAIDNREKRLLILTEVLQRK